MTDADDYYTLLGIQRNATEEEIHHAYFALARQYHPDVNPEDAQSAKKFIKVQAAFDVLNDPAARTRYNRTRISYATVRAARGTVARRPSTSSGWKFVLLPARRWVRDPCATDWLFGPATTLLILGILWIPFYLVRSNWRYTEILYQIKHENLSEAKIEELNAELDAIPVFCIVHTVLSSLVIL